MGDALVPLPVLQEVKSEEQFGLVTSDYTVSFQGLLEIKQEDPLDDLLEHLDDTDTGDLTPNINPTLLDISANASSSRDIVLTPGPSSTGADLSLVSSGKRKTPCADHLEEPQADATVSKKVRVQSPSVNVVVSP